MKRYQRTDDPIPYALADYNAGRANVLRWNGGTASTNSAAFTLRQIGFPGTGQYVARPFCADTPGIDSWRGSGCWARPRPDQLSLVLKLGTSTDK